MIRLLGLLSFLLAVFLLPMNFKLLSDALMVNGSGVWIMLSFMSILTFGSAWMGVKILRRA
ncbi:MAG: hypothetical protein ACK5CY_11145 [Bacteroidia bacterium]|jgi:hypothetical protein